ncbi:hypothetical protein ICW40_14660 [Actinotalea ferrariae]|uniref:hypothetical protein n=1 Tax=Actinotalea ferrariae TaxID=1386098 RepID=UPI001C8C7A71|nr:hypothetical protein [Actinotalea ferrariae]MBX9246045.1 hypothetical protein [Actinotalea ferrariae]
MTWSEVTVVVVGALLLLLWWIWVAASRLDRLHRKVGASRAALDTQLVRRASAATELAASGLLDPVSSVLLGEASWAALSAGENGGAELVEALPDLRVRVAAPSTARVERDLAESELSRTARAALADEDEVAALTADPLGEALLGALADAWYRVQLARRFHNEAVAQTQRMRRKVLVRLLRLHGHARMPHTVEIDDTWPEALARPGEVT